MAASRNDMDKRSQAIDEPTPPESRNGRTLPPPEGRESRVQGTDGGSGDLLVDLTKQFATALWKRLPLSRRQGLGFSDLKSVAKHYAASVEEMEYLRSELQNFLQLVCRTNFATRWQGASPAVAASIGQQELAKWEAAWKLPSEGNERTLSAELGALDLDDAINSLKLALKDRARKLAADLVACLAKGAEEERVGKIAWPSESTCAFHYFQRVIVGTHTERSSGPTKQISQERIKGRHGMALVKEQTSMVHSARYEVRSVRQDQELLASTRQPLGEFAGQVPLSHKQLIKEVPGWLQPFVEVVEGERIREKTSERRREKNTQQWVTKTETERVVYVGDPALILGPFVLSGWSSKPE